MNKPRTIFHAKAQRFLAKAQRFLAERAKERRRIRYRLKQDLQDLRIIGYCHVKPVGYNCKNRACHVEARDIWEFHIKNAPTKRLGFHTETHKLAKKQSRGGLHSPYRARMRKRKDIKKS